MHDVNVSCELWGMTALRLCALAIYFLFRQKKTKLIKFPNDSLLLFRCVAHATSSIFTRVDGSHAVAVRFPSSANLCASDFAKCKSNRNGFSLIFHFPLSDCHAPCTAPDWISLAVQPVGWFNDRNAMNVLV